MLFCMDSPDMRIFALIGRNELAACPDIDVGLEYPYPDAAWQGVSLEHDLWVWTQFVTDPDLRLRTVRGLQEVARVLRDMAGLEGKGVAPKIIEHMQQRVLLAMWPHMDEVVRQATAAPAARAAQEMLKHIQSWRTKSST